MKSTISSEKTRDTSKSVRFAANVAAPAPRSITSRQRDDSDDEDDTIGRRKKRPRLERPNEDEVDDVDDWEGEEIDAEGVPKPMELLDAKRKRRQRQHEKDIEDDEEDDTHIDARTSLLAETKDAENEIAVEPFNMDAEQNDGSGYFDGDTYVFRKRDAEEEPDAWLESLSESKEVSSIPERMNVEEEEGTSMDDLSKEELYNKIVPLVSNSESVLQAVARYGGLLKRHKKSSKVSDGVDDTAVQTAQKALNDLTEAANALMLKGDVDIYQQTRTDLMKLIPDTKPPAFTLGKEKPVVSWEYRGNQDGEIHGPYTTAQMLSWIQAGYFIGAQAVQIRTIRKESLKKKSTAEDLLSDLMEEDEEEEEDKAAEANEVKGEWQSSNDVDFTSYA